MASKTRPNVDDVKLIPLTKNQFALVDAGEYKALSLRSWFATVVGSGYYATSSIYENKKQITISLSHLIVGKKEGYIVKHINGNTLDYRKINLRYERKGVTQRKVNTQKSRKFLSKYKGVSAGHFNYKLNMQMWKAHCAKVYLGSYPTEIEAARSYDVAAKKHYGDNAWLNNVEESSDF